jgi:RimJ/RimL family protein N-acetyltransferase
MEQHGSPGGRVVADSRAILQPAPGVLRGERIIVRGYQDDDVDELYAAIQESIEHLRPWMPWWNTHGSPDDTRAYIRRARAEYLLRESFAMGIFARDGGRCLGSCGLGVTNWDVPAFEIGYWIRQSAEGKGYVSEAARLLTVCAFTTLGAQRLMIRCDARNTRSARVAERLGYRQEGLHRHAHRDTSGNLTDLLYYALIPSEFEAARRTW